MLFKKKKEVDVCISKTKVGDCIAFYSILEKSYIATITKVFLKYFDPDIHRERVSK